MAIRDDFRTWNPKKPRRAEAISHETWADHQVRINDWYTRGLTKKEILAKLSVEHNFHPSKSQLVARMGLWGLQNHRNRPSSVCNWDHLSMDDLLFTTAGQNSSLARRKSHVVTSSITARYLQKSTSAPAVVAVTTHQQPGSSHLTVATSSHSLSALDWSHNRSHLSRTGWLPGNPAAVDMFGDYMHGLLQYFPQQLPLHDYIYEAGAKTTLSEVRVTKMIEVAGYLSAAGLMHEAFDTFLTCFTTVVFYLPTSLDSSDYDFAYSEQLVASSLLQRVQDIIHHDQVLGLLSSTVLGCVRSSSTLDEAYCAGGLLLILMKALMNGRATCPALLKLLQFYHNGIEDFWKPQGYSWVVQPFEIQIVQSTAESLFPALPSALRDREFLYLCSKGAVEVEFLTDNLWVGSRFPEIGADTLGQQFIGNPFIRAKTFDLLTWCRQAILGNQSLLEQRLSDGRAMNPRPEDFGDLIRQILFWFFVHENELASKGSKLDDLDFQSSDVSRFGIAIPDALAIVTKILVRKNEWHNTFKDMTSDDLRSTTLVTWVLQRLGMLMTENGIWQVAYRYFKGAARYRADRISALRPSAVSLGNTFVLLMADPFFEGTDADFMKPLQQTSDKAVGQRDGVDSSDVAMTDVNPVHIEAVDGTIISAPGSIGQQEQARLQASLAAMLNPENDSTSFFESGEQREFRSLALKLQLRKWQSNQKQTAGFENPGADHISVSSHESWRFERVSGMP